MECPIFATESLEILTGNERPHAESDKVNFAVFFDVLVDCVSQLGSEVFEAFPSVSWFKRGGECLDVLFF